MLKISILESQTPKFKHQKSSCSNTKMINNKMFWFKKQHFMKSTQGVTKVVVCGLNCTLKTAVLIQKHGITNDLLRKLQDCTKIRKKA